MPDEATLEQTEHGIVSKGDGWFVVNARPFDRGGYRPMSDGALPE